MTGYESGEIEKTDRVRLREELEVERRGSSEVKPREKIRQD